MRHVYPTDQVVHIWAHQSQDSARNGSNVRFEGRLLYSYSTVIAQLETAPDGSQWAFLSSESLTPTTSKHVSSSSSATRHLKRFYTCAFARWSSHGRTFKELIEPAAVQAVRDLQTILNDARKRKATKLNALIYYGRERARILPVAKLFQVKVDLPEYKVDEATIAEYHEAAKQKAAKEERARIKRQKEQQKEDKAQYIAWLTTGAGRCPQSFITRGADQITIKDVRIHTSKGAECPLDHAVKAIKFYRSRDISDHNTIMFTPYHTNGHKIHLGIFTLDAIDEHGNVKAGCHTFRAAEIQRFIDQWKEVLGL